MHTITKKPPNPCWVELCPERVRGTQSCSTYTCPQFPNKGWGECLQSHINAECEGEPRTPAESSLDATPHPSGIFPRRNPAPRRNLFAQHHLLAEAQLRSNNRWRQRFRRGAGCDQRERFRWGAGQLRGKIPLGCGGCVADEVSVLRTTGRVSRTDPTVGGRPCPVLETQLI